MNTQKSAPKAVTEYFSSLGVRLFCYENADSTNKRAREYSSCAPDVPTLFIADSQSEGRGRLGRSFFSPDSTGLYMTLLVASPENDRFTYITSIAAVEAREAISQVFGIDTEIKWVNDIYLDGKKVSGILAESFPMGEKRYVALGVGVNISTVDFPAELCDKAGSVVLDEVGADELCAMRFALAYEITRRVLEMLDSKESNHIERYRKYSCVIGKRVSFVSGEIRQSGVAVDIDDTGALAVRLDSGKVELLSTGEISLMIQ